MYEYDYDMSPDELRHYGRKGMKWGQHIFGKVKNGVVTYAKKKSAERSERKAEEKRRHDIDELRKKPVKYLTEAEYKERTRLANQEKMLKMLEREVSNLSPQQKSSGENFAKKFMSEAVGRALIDGGKRAMTDMFDKKMKKAFGIDDASDTLSKLKKEVDGLELQVRKKDAEKKLSNEPDPDESLKKAADSAAKWKTIYEAYEKKDKYDKAHPKEDTSRTVETDFADEPVSNVTRDASTVSRGQRYVEQLMLPGPTKKKRR